MLAPIIVKATSRIDRASLTVLATNDPTKRHFLLEALITWVTMLLVAEYCKGLLKGLGWTPMAEDHGKKLKEHWGRLLDGSPDENDVQKMQQETEYVLEQLKKQQVSTVVMQQALIELETVLIERGLIRSEAREISIVISECVWEK